jgi:hypothetical protein
MKKVITKNYKGIKITIKITDIDIVMVNYLTILEYYPKFTSWKEIEDNITNYIDNLLNCKPKTYTELADTLTKYALINEEFDKSKIDPKVCKIIIKNFLDNLI